MFKSKFTVLLVEDDAGDAVLVRRALAHCKTHFEVQNVNLLQDACEFLEEHATDVVLLDLTLDDSQMLEGVRRIRDGHPQLPVIVLTNLVDQAVALEAVELGVQDYLIKSEVSADLIERSIHYAVQRQSVLFENQRLFKELEKVSSRDPLTGLLNRYYFSQELARAWTELERSDIKLSCIVMDVDFFKRVNDLHGHRVGDEVLQALAQKLRELSNQDSVVARYGGEEFVVAMLNASEEEATEWAEQARAELAAHPLTVRGQSISLTMSMGVASSRMEMTGPDELIDQADQALSVAKQSGRNQVVPFKQLMNLRENGQLERTDRFHGLLVRDLMSPIVAPLMESQSLITAVRFMLMLRLESLPVVDDDGKLSGLITEEDLITRAMTSEGWTGAIQDSMSQRPVCFDEDTPARVVCEFLGRISLRRVVIVRNQHPVGVVSRSGILRWQRNHFIAEAPANTAVVPGETGSSMELQTVISELVSEVADLQNRALDGTDVNGPLLITKASRLQEMIDELLGLTPAGHGGDVTTGTLGHLLS